MSIKITLKIPCFSAPYPYFSRKINLESPESRPMKLRDILLCLFVILIWGGNIIAIKIGVTELPPMIVITLRFGLTALLFLPFMKWPGKARFWQIAEVGIYMSVIHQGLLFTAMKMLDASTMAILLQSQILFATLLGWLILKESIHWRTGVGLLIGFSGLLTTLGGPDVSQNPWGFVITMASAVALAASYIRMRQLKDVHAPTFIAIVNGIAMPFVFMFSLIMVPQGWLHLDDANWIKIGPVLAYQALLVSLSHILWQLLLSRNEVAKVTCFVLLMPAVAIALSILLLDEKMHTSLIWGAALTVTGVAIITLRKIQKKQILEVDPVT